MTRDYTEIPGYHGMTQPQARYNYLHDLLEKYQGLTREDINLMESCKVWRVRGELPVLLLLRIPGWESGDLLQLAGRGTA